MRSGGAPAPVGAGAVRAGEREGRVAAAGPLDERVGVGRSELLFNITYWPSPRRAGSEALAVTCNSAYDEYVRGDDQALTPLQKEGLELFFTEANCAECHSGPMFSNFEFVVHGTPQEGVGKSVIEGDDTGREEATGDPADRYEFRVPTLRNVEITPSWRSCGP